MRDRTRKIRRVAIRSAPWMFGLSLLFLANTAALIVLWVDVPRVRESYQSNSDSVELLESFGHDDVIDLGGIETARGTEMLLPVWLRLMGTLGTGHFNFKIVR